ncbi:MAG: methylglyoxal synthase [Nitrospinae bacterium]|nr:methylglyoxal synthase [Nitrospinota bacterium]
MSPHRNPHVKVRFPARKRIAMVAHDSRKKDMLDWARYNKDLLEGRELFATGTTGTILERELGLAITKFKSGPLGGDQQIGARIADHAIDIVIFFWDPLASHPHEPDIQALQRIATVYNIVLACDRSTADFVISSPLMDEPYEKLVVDYEGARAAQVDSLVPPGKGE